jgi:cytochrome c-type biogenesis protein CcmH
MTIFLIAAALLVAASLVLLSRPWWRRPSSGTDSRRALNAAIYRDQLADLEKDRAGGELAEADYQEAKAELQRRLLDDDSETDPALIVSAHPRRTLAALLVLLPVAAAALYWWLGNPAGMDPMARRDFTASDIEDMVSGLAAKLEKEPGNHQGWGMLARSYKAMGRYDEAERAFEKAMPLVEQHAQLLGAYADLLATKSGGNLEGRPEELLTKALKLDPDDLQSLWLAGTAAFNRKDFPTAIRHWEHALKLLPPDSEDARMLTAIVAEAKQKNGAR